MVSSRLRSSWAMRLSVSARAIASSFAVPISSPSSTTDESIWIHAKTRPCCVAMNWSP